MSTSVVVTAAGGVAPGADTLEALFEKACFGGTLAPVQGFDPRGLADPRVHEVRDFDPKHWFGNQNFRPLNRPALFTALAANRAIEASGWTGEQIQERELGLVLGSMFGSIHTIAHFDYCAQKDGPKYAKPLDFANTVINAPAGQTAIWHGLQGINSTIATGTTSGLQAIGYAAGLIRSGRSTGLLAGGVEELCFEAFLGFSRLGCLAPLGASLSGAPFAPGSAGFHLGEGCGMVLLEEEQAALAHGARPLARVLGFGSAFDPSQGKDPARAAEAAARGIRAALDQAGLAPDGIDGVLASANGWEPTDSAEWAALEAVFGEAPPPTTALKAALGECLGASGAFHVMVGLGCFERQQLPGLVGLDASARSQSALSGQTRDVALRHLLVHAVGLEGGSCALILGKP